MEVQELLEQVDIVEYIAQYCDLEEKNGEFWALSPFKEEKTPSFSIRKENQRFYDFSSGVGGNLIHFIRKYHNCGFERALEIIRDFAKLSGTDIEHTIRLGTTQIAKRFRQYDPVKKESKTVVLPKDYMSRYEFNLDKLRAWVDEGIGFDTLSRFEVKYDSFSDRIVFPIKSYTGDIINICGRTLDPNYKEKKIRKYTYFKPLGILDTLYGFSDNQEEIMKKKEIIIFEGSKSVMLASEWGVHNTCAILTSHLNPQQMLFLIKLGIRVVFALDEDVDVLSDKNIQKLKRYLTIDYIKDTDKVLQSKMSPVDMGREVFLKLYNERIRI
ncbi:MAG: hypothetical protein E7413_00970 [Ruminococcaceae bacterium]|nr:hypothetical protein [Oscillospiraceae bacterium]